MKKQSMLFLVLHVLYLFSAHIVATEEITEEQYEAFWATPKEKPLYKRPMVYGRAAIAAGTLAALAAAAYAGLALWQRNQINNVLKKYGQKITTISLEQRVLVIAAYTKNLKGMRTLSTIALSGTGEWLLPAMAELYFKEAPTQKNIEQLSSLLQELPAQ